MKTILKHTLYLLFIPLLLVNLSCNKDDDSNDGNDDGNIQTYIKFTLNGQQYSSEACTLTVATNDNNNFGMSGADSSFNVTFNVYESFNYNSSYQIPGSASSFITFNLTVNGSQVIYQVDDSAGSGVLQTAEAVTIEPYFEGVKGTFNFTAVNSADSTDVITVTNGEFLAQKEDYNG
jgi:hypothetical protein